jgi:hypothetical protein
MPYRQWRWALIWCSGLGGSEKFFVSPRARSKMKERERKAERLASSEKKSVRSPALRDGAEVTERVGRSRERAERERRRFVVS